MSLPDGGGVTMQAEAAPQISLAHRLAALPAEQLREILSDLPADALGALPFCWPLWARPDQLPPSGDWRTWLLLGGRGSGKTRSSAEWVRDQMESGRRRQLGIIGPTADAVRRIQVEGPSGIMAVAPPWCRPSYEPSTRKIVWPNGSVGHLFSAEEPDRLRGPNLDSAWCDEMTSWSNAAAVWDMLSMALRMPGPAGHAPKVLISTTPKPSALLKSIMAAPSTVITRAKTSDNAANLDASTLRYLHDKYARTTLGRQELDAELLEDAEGALWNRAMLDASRVGFAPQLRRVVVAIDPSGGGSKSNDECGIVAMGVAADGHGYVLGDVSGKFSPEAWARRAIDAYRLHGADRVVAESNFGAGMVEATLRAVDPNVPVRMVHASRGKAIRAEPVVALFEQNRIHLVGHYPQLEDELCTWEPLGNAPSPGRLDAMVWAATDLMLGEQAKPARWIGTAELARLGFTFAR